MSFLLSRKSEVSENYRVCAGDPGKVPGTGAFAPLMDGVAKVLGFMPRNASHFILDPNPTQVCVCVPTRNRARLHVRSVCVA